VNESHISDDKETILGMPKEKFFEMAETMVIAIPHRGSEGISAGLLHAAMEWRLAGCHVETPEDQFGGFIELTRAALARKFLNTCAENPKRDKLIFIDADENVNPMSVFQLASWDLPIVSGVVCSYNPQRGIFACFTMKDKYGVARFPSVKYTNKLPARGLIKVNSCGTGLICIKKQVFESIFESGEKPFYIPEKVRTDAVETGVLKIGEDISFCQQAKKLGFDICVDLSVHAVHFKTTGICWPMVNLDDTVKPEEFQVDMRDFLHG